MSPLKGIKLAFVGQYNIILTKRAELVRAISILGMIHVCVQWGLMLHGLVARLSIHLSFNVGLPNNNKLIETEHIYSSI